MVNLHVVYSMVADLNTKALGDLEVMYSMVVHLNTEALGYLQVIYSMVAHLKCPVDSEFLFTAGAGFTKLCALLKLDFLTSAYKKCMR